MANLTQSQIDLLSGLVTDIRNKELPEEFYLFWGVDGAVVCFDQRMHSAPSITKSKLDILESHGLIHSDVEYETDVSTFGGRQTHVQRERTRVVSVTQKGYDFVDNPKKETLMDDMKPGSVTITHFNGIFGNIHGGNVMQNFNVSVEKGKLDSLTEFLKSKGLEESDISALKVAIIDDPPAPKNGVLGEKTATWIADLTKRSLMGTWKIGRDIGVGVIAQAVSQYYGFSS